MRPRWLRFNERDQMAFRACLAFLEGRLEEKTTIDWAVRLPKADEAKKLAIRELTNEFHAGKIKEPWKTAWRLIAESWDAEPHEKHEVHDVNRRLLTGERSRKLIDDIVRIVNPSLEISERSSNKKRKIKSIEDLFYASLSGAELISPDQLAIDKIKEKDFLISIATSIEATITNSLELARRIGWDGKRHWKIGGLHRAYFVATSFRDEGESEPDAFSHGIAPSVKFLYLVVSRLADVDLPTAIHFVRRWQAIGCPILLRLWTAISRDPKITEPDTVASFLLSLDRHHFWDIHEYPEVAELRAVRFKDMSPKQQKAIVDRICKRPPRNLWPRDIEASRIESGQLYFAIRELRRIQIAGGVLTKDKERWVDEQIRQFEELKQMTRVDNGFPGGVTTTFLSPRIESRFNLLEGEKRLKALETALNATREEDRHSNEGASNWIKQAANTLSLLSDLESSHTSNNSYAMVWEQFGWAHSPSSGNAGETSRDISSEATRALTAFSALSDDVLQQALDGITHWLSAWQKHVATRPTALELWLRLWPFASEKTNAQQPEEEAPDLSIVARVHGDEPMDLDTLNTPVGRLVGVFLSACPNLTINPHPFAQEACHLRIMRDAIFSSTGRSLLIAQHRLIESLSYFLEADEDWSHRNLITPLNIDSPSSLALWRAIARRIRPRKVLIFIGETMITRATDKRLGRETRRTFVFNLTVDCLHALKDGITPVVEKQKIIQMLRSLDDELRATGAEAIQRFVRDLSIQREDDPTPPSPEQLFRLSARPFLEQFWPQERSLTTPGVSKALADLPAVCGEAFAEAVSAIERFLVPFDCWSMMDYGLYGTEDDKLKLANIDTPIKASAFLHLLNLTVGSSEGAVIPHELGDALDQIRTIAPDLSEDRAFRRLAAAARR